MTATPTSTAGLVEVEASAGKTDCIILGLAPTGGQFAPVAVLRSGEKQLVDLTRYQESGGVLSGWAVFLHGGKAVPLADQISFASIR